MVKPIVWLYVIARLGVAQPATEGPVQIRVTSKSANQQSAIVYGHGWRVAATNSAKAILIADSAVVATPFTIESPNAGGVEVVTVRAVGVDAQVAVEVTSPSASSLTAVGAFVIVNTSPRHTSVQAFGSEEASRAAAAGKRPTVPRS